MRIRRNNVMMESKTGSHNPNNLIIPSSRWRIVCSIQDFTPRTGNTSLNFSTSIESNLKIAKVLSIFICLEWSTWREIVDRLRMYFDKLLARVAAGGWILAGVFGGWLLVGVFGGWLLAGVFGGWLLAGVGSFFCTGSLGVGADEFLRGVLLPLTCWCHASFAGWSDRWRGVLIWRQRGEVLAWWRGWWHLFHLKCKGFKS